MSTRLHTSTGTFGTAPVFFAAISTILGAIMFLRFGYAVGNTGFLGTLFIILIGHLITVPTAMAIAEIATNQKVEGGGEYFIVSRSFGLTIGAAIGIALYFSQAISVAFYTIAFAEAFDPVFDFLRENYHWTYDDKRLVSVPVVILMTVLIAKKGAALGVKALYAVVGTLFVSLAFFFLGHPIENMGSGFHALMETTRDPDPFFLVFAICFPAFTGMTAGVGLSGELKNPGRSIPLGTLSATFTGMVVYVLIAYKLAISAPAEALSSDQLIMSRIAIWGPIIPIGLACATISSAMGSYMVAPRTLQAIALDRVLPWPRVTSWLARGETNGGGKSEPFNASVVTAVIALVFVLMGDVNFVAQIISMFFMVTYGSLCSISFLEHFAADPSYRPTFRSRWYISLGGAILSMWLMFKMSGFYAAVSIVLMFALYLSLSRYNEDKRGLAAIFQGAIFQISRQLQVFLQKSRKQAGTNWRPSVVCISHDSFQRFEAFELLRWISHRYGFGTYIHHIEGYLSSATREEANDAMRRLVQMAEVTESNVYIDTIVSPSYTTAISQLIQLPGISGKENNMVLFEFSKASPEGLDRIVDNYPLISTMGFDVCILASSDRGFGYRREIHIWLSPRDYENSTLMILLSYIVLGHPEWKRGIIKIFSVVEEAEVEREKKTLLELTRSGRLPISPKNMELIPSDGARPRREIVAERSRDADLVVLGFRAEAVKRSGTDLFLGYEDVGNVLFVNTRKEIELVRESESAEAAPQAAEAAKADGEGDGAEEVKVAPVETAAAGEPPAHRGAGKEKK